MTLIFKPAKSVLEDYPSEWPPKQYFVNWRQVSELQTQALNKLVKDGASETRVDTFLRKNRDLLAACLNFTRFGHHGSWVIPQQAIRPSTAVEIGLKPDYIVGGASSDGYSWYVIELKGVTDSIFAEKKGKLYFSSTANRGVFQLLEYIDYCASIQMYLRDVLGLTDFREPKGILIIGNEEELVNNDSRQRLKSAWSRIAGDRIQIRTYDALLRSNP